MKNTTRPKIAYVITKANGGGAQRYLYDLVATMSASYDITVILGGSGILKEKLESINIPVISLPNLIRDTDIAHDINSAYDLYKIFKDLKPDIVHLNSSKIGGLGALSARCAKIPHIIFTAHGWAFNEKRPLYQKIIIGLIYWITIQLCSKTILVSHALYNQIEWWPGIHNKTEIIWLGIDSKVLALRKSARSRISSLQPSIFPPEKKSKNKITHIVSLGELHPIKGHIFALQAFKKIYKKYSLHYTIIGEGEYRNVLEKTIHELGISDHVTLAGHINNIAHELKAFDIMLMPSLSEALGYAVLEAGRAELPIIASSVGGIPEIIEDMHSGILVQPSKPEEIAYGLELLLENPELQKKYGSALKERVARFFSQKSMLSKTDTVYKNLLNSTKSIEAPKIHS